MTAPPPLPRLRPRRMALWIGAGLVALIAVCAVFAPVLTPYSPYAQSLLDRMQPPVFLDGGSMAHLLGTDDLGRDELSMLLYGARLSLGIGLGTVAMSAVIGIGLGLAAGYFGGMVELAVMFLLTVRLSLPVMLVALALVGLLGNSLALIMAVLSGFLWDRFLVITRSLCQRARQQDYVLAARAAGCSDLYILAREILPVIAPSLIVVATVEVSHAVMLEAALSFLGLGVQPPAASWGLMIAAAKDSFFFTPWLVNIPGLAVFVLVLGINLLGNGLRDLISPDSKH
jgi:peptide/nickel transport system permease protein